MEGYPDWSTRLFNRRYANWSDDPVHEKVLTGEAIAIQLSGDLLHESGEDIAVYLQKQNRYTSLQAEQMFARGKRVGAGKLLFSPIFRFIRFCVFRLGMLDGLPGLVHILIGCFNSFCKYAKLFELHRTTINRKNESTGHRRRRIHRHVCQQTVAAARATRLSASTI